MKPDYNKSLSAKIKRRNAQGFEGVGSYNGVGPKHTYGDYRDPLQNHKHDGDVRQKYNPDTEMNEIVVCPNRHQHMINQAKHYGSRHAGSKSMKTLMSHF